MLSAKKKHRPTQTLNPDQKEAVKECNRPVLVLAGAGSGKTSVISLKISYLAEEKGIDPNRIAAITFTNKAADEMGSRVNKLLQLRDRRPWISTFHTLGLKILRKEYSKIGYRKGFTILNESDQNQIVQDIVRRKSPSQDTLSPLVKHTISNWKNQLLAPEEIAVGNIATPSDELALKCYQDYGEELFSYNVVDFDDLIFGPVRLLKENKEALQEWQNQIEFLLVDEYQDTNTSQYELIKILLGPNGHLTAVGDDDQSIYGWRGARAENIDQLSADYPDLKVVKLEQNYRSSGTILNVANQLIKTNHHKYEKRLWSDKGFGEKVRVLSALDEHDEVIRIVNDIQHRRLVHKTNYGDFAVLMRSNHQARLFEHVFREREIPYILSGGRSFFDHAEIKDCISYLRIIVNPLDNSAFLRIVNRPRRNIGTKTLRRASEFALEKGFSLSQVGQSEHLKKIVGPRAYQALHDFTHWILELSKRAEYEAPATLFATILSDVNYNDWIAFESKDIAKTEKKLANVAELTDWIERLTLKAEKTRLENIVEALTLYDISERNSERRETDEKVSLATIHAAKGLEYEHVYIAGFEENLLPHKASVEKNDIEEERRLAYVGITRAKKTLCFSFANRRKRYGATEECHPSRFLEELPSNEMQWEGQTAENKELNAKHAKGTFKTLQNLLRD